MSKTDWFPNPKSSWDTAVSYWGWGWRKQSPILPTSLSLGKKEEEALWNGMERAQQMKQEKKVENKVLKGV